VPAVPKVLEVLEVLVLKVPQVLVPRVPWRWCHDAPRLRYDPRVIVLPRSCP